MSRSKSPLPILPLLNGSVLLPGVILRIPVSDRPDAALLISSQAKTSKGDLGALSLGCVPLILSKTEEEDQKSTTGSYPSDFEELESLDTKASIRKGDLFGYGTLARITGVQGTRSELILTVQGVSRFKINRVTKVQPFFEAKVTHFDENGMWRVYLTHPDHRFAEGSLE